MANPLYGQNKFDNAVDNSTGQIIHITPASDGTAIADAETVVLKTSDAGNRYFINIADNTATFRLPSVFSSKGAEFHFHLDIDSDAEASKDVIVFTDSTAEFIIGALTDGGTVHDSTVADDQILWDTSTGAAGGGDRMSVVSDGKHWYITGSAALTAGIFVSGTATRA
jgi:hypothetical protein